MNVLERKMFVQKFKAGGDARLPITAGGADPRLPITIIIEERKKRGLPVSLNNPEVIKQTEALQSGIPVSEIFQDQSFNPIYEPNVKSMIDRGVPAEQIQANFAQMGLPISLYQIQQMGGVPQEKLQITEKVEVPDFSEQISNISTQSTLSTPTNLEPNQVFLGGITYNLPVDFADKVRAGDYGQVALFDIIRDTNVKLGSNISKTLEEYSDRVEPFGLSKKVAPEMSFEERRGTFATPETVTSATIDTLRDVGDIATGIIKKPFYFGVELGAGPSARRALETALENEDPHRRTRKTILSLGGVTVAEQDEEETETADSITTDLKNISETVVTAPRLNKDEKVLNVDVDRPEDPTKITNEEILKREAEEALKNEQQQLVDEMETDDDIFQSFADRKELVFGKDYGPGTGKTLGDAIALLPGEPRAADEVDTTVEKKSRRLIDGAGLARFLSAVGMQGDARNLMELGTKGAATFAALEEQDRAKELEQKRQLELLGVKEYFDAISDLKKSGMTVSDEIKLVNQGTEVDKAVASYKRDATNLAHINELIRLGEVLQGKNGFQIFLKRYVAKTKQFLGTKVVDPRDGKRKTINDMDFESLDPVTQFDLLNKIITQKNIKALLQEEGKTISNIDRSIVEQIMGKLTPGVSVPEALQALKMARNDTIESLLAHKDTIMGISSYLDQKGYTPASQKNQPNVFLEIANFNKKSGLSYFVNDKGIGNLPEDVITIDLQGNRID